MALNVNVHARHLTFAVFVFLTLRPLQPVFCVGVAIGVDAVPQAAHWLARHPGAKTQHLEWLKTTFGKKVMLRSFVQHNNKHLLKMHHITPITSHRLLFVDVTAHDTAVFRSLFRFVFAGHFPRPSMPSVSSGGGPKSVAAAVDKKCMEAVASRCEAQDVTESAVKKLSNAVDEVVLSMLDRASGSAIGTRLYKLENKVQMVPIYMKVCLPTWLEFCLPNGLVAVGLVAYCSIWHWRLSATIT